MTEYEFRKLKKLVKEIAKSDDEEQRENFEEFIFNQISYNQAERNRAELERDKILYLIYLKERG